MAVYYSNFLRPGTLKLVPGRGWLAVGFASTPDAAHAEGFALPAGEDEAGNPLWRLTVGEDELPGRYLLVDGLFTPAEG